MLQPPMNPVPGAGPLVAPAEALDSANGAAPIITTSVIFVIHLLVIVLSF
jgi:hypothetical protein